MCTKIFAITTLLLCLCCPPIQAETYLVVGDQFPLLCEQGPDGTVHGLAVDVATRISTRLGHTFQFKLYPWKRAQQMAASGEADILMPPYKTAEREQWLDFSAEPFNIDLGVFYVLSTSTLSWNGNYAKLAGKTVSTVLGWNYGQDFEKNRQILSLDAAPGIDNSFQKLLAGRVDLVATNEREALASIMRLGIHDRVKQLMPPIHHAGNYFGFSRKKNLDLLKMQFNQCLHDMIESGELLELQKKYHLRTE